MKKLQILIILILIGSAVFSLGRTFIDIYSRANRLDVLKEEVSSLEKENADIKKKIAEAGKDAFTEKEARNRLGYSLPGEKVLIVSGNSAKSDEPVILGEKVTESQKEKPLIAWKKLLLW